MASRAAVGPVLRRALHSTTKSTAPSLSGVPARSKPIFRAKAFGAPGSSADSTASTSTPNLLPGAGSALEVVDVAELQVLSKNKLNEKHVGTAMLYPETFANKVLDSSVPRTLRRDLSLTSRPTTVLRKATVSLVQRVKGKQQLQFVLGGMAGTGRSTVLLQTVAALQADGWLVLYVPNAYDLVDAKHAFNHPKGGDAVYDQPVVAQLLLKRFLSINEKSALSKLDKDVLQKVERGSKDLATASSALDKLLKSSQQGAPLLVAIDSAEALYKRSKYVSAVNKPLKPEQLSVPRALRACLAGNDIYPSVTVIAALDKSASLGALKAKDLAPGPLTRSEAAGIYQHMSDTLLLENEPSDASFLEALVGSDGNARLFTRGLGAIPGGTARGVVKKGRSRGVSVRDDRLHTVVVTEPAVSAVA